MNSRSQYLVRPRPMPGESLSSWRQRAGQANGYKFFPLFEKELRRSDHDVGRSSDVLKWLAWSFDVAEETLKSMTLESFSLVALGPVGTRRHPEWLLRSRYSSGALAFGPVYCPLCLHSDQVPYFRLSWRLGFLTTCEVHHCRLLDRCPTCGAGVWPSWSTQASSPKYPDTFERCFQCGASLGTRSVLHDDPSVAIQLLSMIRTGTAQLTDGVVVSAEEYLRAISGIAGLFLRNRSHRQIRKSPGPFVELTQMFDDTDRPHNLLDLTVEERGPLVNAAAYLLAEWPSRLIDFCVSANVTAEHFSPQRAQLPPWFDAIVKDSLSLQKRGITHADVTATTRLLQAQGVAVTKAELCRRLGSQATAISCLQLRRRVGTADELSCVLQTIDECLSTSYYRSTSKEVCLRDACILTISVLRKVSLSDVSAMTTGQVTIALTSLPTNLPVLINAGDRLKTWISSYLEMRISRAKYQRSSNLLFLPIHGSKDVARSARRYVLKAYSTIDPSLLREPSIFWTLVSDSGYLSPQDI